jgi:hypothetical protein
MAKLTLWIVVFHHRYGESYFPIIQETKPTYQQMVIEALKDSFVAGREDEWLELEHFENVPVMDNSTDRKITALLKAAKDVIVTMDEGGELFREDCDELEMYGDAAELIIALDNFDDRYTKDIGHLVASARKKFPNGIEDDEQCS